MLARGLPVNLSMRSPHAIMPSWMPRAADMMNICDQPAGISVTVALMPAPMKVSEAAMWCAMGWLSGEKTTIGIPCVYPSMVPS